MQIHKFFDLAALKWRKDSLDRLLNEDSIKAILVADCVENIELHESKAMPLTIFKFLEKLGLSLVVKVSVLGLLHISNPNGRVHDF